MSSEQSKHDVGEKYTMDATESLLAAYRTAALPVEYTGSAHRTLYDRGLDVLQERHSISQIDQPQSESGSGDSDGASLDLHGLIDRFGTIAIDRGLDRKVTGEPPFRDPAVLATTATLASYIITNQEKYKGVPEKNSKLLTDIRDYYITRLTRMIREHNDQDIILQELAEVLYSKPEPEDGPIPSRICTDVREMDEFGGRLYLEIPVASASPQCLVYRSDGSVGARYNADTGEKEGDLLTHTKDNHLYVPAVHAEYKLRERLKDDFFALLFSIEDTLGDEQQEWFLNGEYGMVKELEKWVRTGQNQRIYNDWDPDTQFARTIENAIGDADSYQTGQTFTLSALYEILSEYEPERDWEKKRLRRITSPEALHESLDAVIESMPTWERVTTGTETDAYYIDETSSQYKEVHVDEISDLFELPCFQNLRDKLHQQPPVRKWLFSFVRLCSWLPQYYDADDEKLVQDIKDIFSQFPWYDEATTEYQTRYELSNTIAGNTPLPMHCDNDTMQLFCIGQETCDYNIYSSIDFDKELYQEIDERNSS
ncbi:hypothetical protein SAMN05216388_100917 [Halorientalis persicus]|uniref:Uncharacterized protein n=2 Tax=Halorientalis persicus TaxID=1367881 RepID=A0A1H8MJ59_9EURY|nr:hypothetical protein SAMN05216388_100917 [Halorientalis persicus]